MAQRVRMFIRYLAATDDSPVGLVALEYLKSLLRIAPVRLLSVSGGLSGHWEGYSTALATPIGPAYVNVVCCHPVRWAWKQPITMVNRNPDGTVRGTERTSGDVELYTQSVRNVLCIAGSAAPLLPLQCAAAAKYEARIVDSMDLQSYLGGLTRHCTGTVIPVPVVDHDAVRRVVMA